MNSARNPSPPPGHEKLMKLSPPCLGVRTLRPTFVPRLQFCAWAGVPERLRNTSAHATVGRFMADTLLRRPGRRDRSARERRLAGGVAHADASRAQEPLCRNP